MTKVGIEFFGVDAGARAQCKSYLSQLEQLRAETARVTKAATSGAEATVAAAEAKVAALVEERAVIRANMLAYQQLAAAAVKGSERQVAATQLATAAQAELGLTARATATKIAAAANVAVLATRRLVKPVLAITALAGYLGFGYEEAMQRIRTSAGASREELERMQKDVLELAKTMEGGGQSPVKLANALYYLESAGIRGEKALRSLSAAAVNAMVTDADLIQATKALAAVRKTDIEGAEDETKAIGTLNAIVGAGMMTLEDLTAALSTGVLPVAANLGITLPQLGAALDVFTIANVPAQQAATKLTATFARMLSPTGQAQKSLKALGIESQELGVALQRGGLTAALELLVTRYREAEQAAGKVYASQQLMAAFGRSRGGAAILALVEGWDTYRQSLEQVNRTTKDYQRNAKEAMQDPSERIKVSLASLQASLTEIGLALLPTFADLAQSLATLVKGLQSVADVMGGWDPAFRLLLGGILVSKVAALIVWISKLRKAIYGLAAAEATAGTTGAAAFAKQSKAAAIFYTRLVPILAALWAVDEALKAIRDGKGLGDVLGAEPAGGAGDLLPNWDPVRKKWVDQLSGRPLSAEQQARWNKKDAYTKAFRSTVTQKALTLGEGSGGVYETGGGHGGLAKPGTAMDCSGYTYQVFTQSGFLGFPGTSEAQWETRSGPNWGSQRIKPSQAMPGDLVFSRGSPKYPPPGHVGIVVSGSGKSADVMQYYSTGKPANTVRLGSIPGLIGVKRFFIVERSGTDKSKPGDRDTRYSPPAAPSYVETSAADIGEERATARALVKKVERILSPTLRARLRRQAQALNAAYQHVGSDEEREKLRKRLDALSRVVEAGLDLRPATLEARKTARSFARQIEEIVTPTLRAKLRTQLAQVSKALRDVASDKELAAIKKRLAKLKDAIAGALEVDRLKLSLRIDFQRLANQLAGLPAALQAALNQRLSELYRGLTRATTEEMIDAIEEQLSALQQAYEEAIEQLEGAVAQPFERFGDGLLRLFDAQTERLREAARARVEILGGIFEIGIDELTPAEKRLKEMEDRQSAGDVQQRIADARRGLEEARKLRPGWDGTLEEIGRRILDAERELNDALAEEERQALSERAQVEREAANKALDDEQQRIEDEREAKRDQLQVRLDEISEMLLSDEPAIVAEGQHAIADLLADPEYAALVENAGDLIGNYFAAGFETAIDRMTTAINELIAALNQLGLTAGSGAAGEFYIPGGSGSGSPSGYDPTHPTFQRGGLVPGSYIAREDTVMGRLTPGEYVLDRSTTHRLNRFLAGGGGGDTYNIAVHQHFNRSIFGDRRKVARELGAEVESELGRTIGYESRRG